MSWRRVLLDVADRSRALRLAGAWYGRSRLTVLAYHRVAALDGGPFETYRRNVSATPEAFGGQMEAVAAAFNPVSLADVVAWLDGGPRLPTRPLLVTFDDGYADNRDVALPVLRSQGIPAVIFLATDHIGTALPFWWDLAAWSFTHTSRTSATLPLLGPRSWSDAGEREQVLGDWLERLKLRAEAERAAAIADLAKILEVEPGPGAFSGTYLSWDDVRAMAGEEVEFGAHTRTHPILTRVGEEQARAEIVGSRDRIETVLGARPRGFAYPNGQAADVNPAVRRMVGEAGFRMAFTLATGPARAAEVRADPLMVRRVYVHHRDHPARFAAKVFGASRLTGIAP